MSCRRLSVTTNIRGRWIARRLRRDRALRSFDQRSDAILYAISIAEPGDRIALHNEDGTVDKVLEVQ